MGDLGRGSVGVGGVTVVVGVGLCGGVAGTVLIRGVIALAALGRSGIVLAEEL